MTDLFPAVAALYPPDIVKTLQNPFETSGISDAGSTQFLECRVIVHNFNAFVGTDTIRGPKTVFHDTYASNNVFQAGNLTRVLTDTGYLLVFGPSRGCGCGSRLRTWNPYGSVIKSERKK